MAITSAECTIFCGLCHGTVECLKGNVMLTICQPWNKHYFTMRKCQKKTPYPGIQYAATGT